MNIGNASPIFCSHFFIILSKWLHNPTLIDIPKHKTPACSQCCNENSTWIKSCSEKKGQNQRFWSSYFPWLYKKYINLFCIHAGSNYLLCKIHALTILMQVHNDLHSCTSFGTFPWNPFPRDSRSFTPTHLRVKFNHL